MAARSFQTISEVETEAESPGTVEKKDSSIAAQALVMILTGLSQKALIAISNLFTMVALFSAWWLWHGVLVSPTLLQLVGIGLYATFILILEVVRRKK